MKKNWSNINIITSFLNKNKLDITCVVVRKRWINIQFLRKHLLEMFMCQKSFLYMCDIMQGNNDVPWAR